MRVNGVSSEDAALGAIVAAWPQLSPDERARVAAFVCNLVNERSPTASASPNHSSAAVPSPDAAPRRGLPRISDGRSLAREGVQSPSGGDAGATSPRAPDDARASAGGAAAPRPVVDGGAP